MILLLLTIVVIVCNCLLGLVAISKNPKSATHQLLLLLSILFSLWAFSNYFSVVKTSAGEILFWIRIVMAVSGTLVPTLFLLAQAFPTRSLNLSKPILLAILGYTILIQILSFTPLIFTRVVIVNNLVEPVPGPAIVLYAIDILGFIALTLLILLRKFRSFSGLQKTQLKFMLMGIGVTFILGAFTNFILVNVLKITSFVALGPFFSLFLIAAITYAIVRHRFLDIQLLIARTIAYLMLVGIVGLLYAFGLFITGSLVLGISSPTRQIGVSTGLALLMAFSFQPIRRLLEKLTDKIFYKDHYDTNEVLGRLSRIMASTIREDELTHAILQVLLSELRINNASFILLQDGRVSDVRSEGIESKFSIDENELKTISETKGMLIFEDLEEGSIKSLMRELDLAVIDHLRTEGNQVGLLALGTKSSGGIYSDQDLNLVEIFSPEAAVAIQNTQSYEEIRRFNITLQEEVNKATAELRDANEKLTQLDKLKDEFVSLASHELRTPMTAIKSYTWMLLNGKAPDKQHEYLQVVYDSTERLIHLVNDMLDISRIESGRVQMKPAPFDIGELATQVVNEFKPKAAEHQVSLELQKDSAPITVNADHDKIQEVIENLLSNAVKFTPANGHVTISIAKIENQVKLSVNDTGKGISTEDQQKLFKKFGRLDNTLTGISSEPGTGLGLFICKQYIDLSGGKIWVESEVGKGSTFAFTLPC